MSEINLAGVRVEKSETRYHQDTVLSQSIWAFGMRKVDQVRGWFYFSGFIPPDAKRRGVEKRDPNTPVEVIRGVRTEANDKTAERYMAELRARSNKVPSMQTARFRRDVTGKVVDLHKAQRKAT